MKWVIWSLVIAVLCGIIGNWLGSITFLYISLMEYTIYKKNQAVDEMHKEYESLRKAFNELARRHVGKDTHNEQ